MVRIWLLALSLVMAPLSAQDNELETRIKATFLYKFCQYVQWPEHVFASAETPIVIGVANADVLAAELALTVQNRTVNGRQVQIRYVDTGDALTGVHLLFSRVSIDPKWLSATQPILTVTEDASYQQAGMINFVVDDNKVRFDINYGSTEQAGLRISSQLLSVARHVRTGGG